MNISDLPRVVEYLKKNGIEAQEDCFVVAAKLPFSGRTIQVKDWTEACFLVRMVGHAD